MKKGGIGCFVFALVLAQAALAYGAGVAGSVTDANGNGIEGVRVFFKDAKGAIVGSAETGRNGGYEIQGLPGGDFTVTLDPLSTGVKGNSVMMSLQPNEFACLDWLASPTAPALALARSSVLAQTSAGINPSLGAAACRDPAAFAALGAGAAVLLAGGVGTGICAAVGACFGGEPGPGPRRSIRRFGD